MANEKRLIDANELMDAFRRYMVERCDRKKCVSEENCKTCEKPCLWRKIVSIAPTVDAVEVVRCRDCRKSMLWRKPVDKVIGECFIRKMNSEDEQFCMVGADDFCSYGERKDND